MTNAAILYPLFVQVALTFFLMSWLAIVRVKVAQRGEVRLSDIALDASAWPADIVKIGNCVLNQFQTPVLFYVVSALLMITAGLNTLHVALAWIFVLSRLVHAAIHATTNNVSHRFYAFLVAIVALVTMWILFALDIIFKGL